MSCPLNDVDHAPAETVGAIQYYIINGQTPDEQVAFFRLLMQRQPNLVWQRAEADRTDGLTLFCEMGCGKQVALRFPAALCGYQGIGPRATVKILVEAGFGHPEHIEAHIYQQYEDRKEIRCFDKK